MHGLDSNDATLMPLPMGHMSGLLNGALVPAVAPMHLRLMERWEPDRALDFIERDRVTFMVGPTPLFVSLIDTSGFTSQKVASLRLVASGFAGVSPAFIDDTSARLGARIKRSYGSTEAPTVSTTRAEDPVERGRDTDGRSTGWARLRVTEPATGNELPAGEVGELWLRGPELFVGYADPEQTRAAITRGWFRTGDLATLDEAGWLTIVGRIKDIIIRAGENISATEVEAVLEAHPAVRQAVAVGVPDDRLGERVCAFVVAFEPFDLEECRRWFEQCGIARYKTPERIVQLDELPLLASAKADRAALRQRAATL
jgi:cyclohexanecarboxylate-CoA ligase